MNKSYKNESRIFAIILLILAVLIFNGCANVTPIENCRNFEPYGFWFGLWHGFIFPVSFWGSIIYDGIAFYAVNNNGNPYDLGFFLGQFIAGFIFIRIFALIIKPTTKHVEFNSPEYFRYK